MAALPLLVFDTNIVMDVLLDRDRNEAILLVELAEAKRVDLAMPEYVLMEFRGTALRWIRDEIERLRSVRRSANEWARSRELDKPADVIRTATADIEDKLKTLQGQVDLVSKRIRSRSASGSTHGRTTHARGSAVPGRPSARPTGGWAQGLPDLRGCARDCGGRTGDCKAEVPRDS